MPEQFPSYTSSDTEKTDDTKKYPKHTLLSRFVTEHVLSRNETLPIEEELAIREQYASMSLREKAEKLYAKLIGYRLDKQHAREEEEIEPTDPFLISEIKVLWEDESVRALALEKYDEMREDSASFRKSSTGEAYQTLTEKIEAAEQQFRDLERRLWLGEITRPSAKESAESKRAMRARELILLRQKQADILSLKDVPSTVEYTDVAARLSYDQLMEYRDQAKEGFVWLPSRFDIHRKIVSALQNGRWPELVGEAGSGKSEQADAAALELTGSKPTHIAASARTNERDLIADKEVMEGQSFERYGAAMQAATGFENSLEAVPTCTHGRIFRIDEAGRLGDQGYSAIKELRQKKTGDLLHGKKVLPGFGSIWTTNPVGPRYPDRNPLDPAMRREVAEIEVPYPPMTPEHPELYEFMLASLLDDKGHIEVAEKELAPAYKTVPVPEGSTTSDGKEIESSLELLKEGNDMSHGILYRMSFALSEVQKAFVYGNKVPVPDDALTYKTENDGSINISQNGPEQLTLSSSTITLGEIASWMEGWKTRLQKDDVDFHVGTLSEWIDFKLRTYVEQADADDKPKLFAIFNHFNLFLQKPDLSNTVPMTAKQIGYLSPRVPRPVKLKEVAPDAEAEGKKQKEKRPARLEEIRPLETTEKMLKGGERVFVKIPSVLEFVKDGKKIKLRNRSGFTLKNKRYVFEGISDDKAIVRLSSEVLCEAWESSKIETAEKFAVSIEKAAEILGKENVLGPEDSEKTFGTIIDPELIPDIPFEVEALEKAKERGEMLVFRNPVIAGGIPLTPLKMHELLVKKFAASGKGLPLYEADGWRKNDPAFNAEVPTLRWALVSKEVLPETTSKNYFEQTEEILRVVKDEVYARTPLPKDSEDAIKQFEAYVAKTFKGKTKTKIAELLGGNDWQKYTKELSELKINTLFRRTVSEALYDTLLYFDKNDQRLLENTYDWTTSRDSEGNLLILGRFGTRGADVYGDRAYHSVSDLGLCLSRT